MNSTRARRHKQNIYVEETSHIANRLLGYRIRFADPTNSKNKQTSEIEIGTTNFDIAEIFLHKNVPIEFTEALNSATYECKKKTGYGSQQSVRNYFDSLTSVKAPFEVYKHGKEKTIRYKRNYLKSNKG